MAETVVLKRAGVERMAEQLGHRLGRWDPAAFTGTGVKAQCQTCGRQVVLVDGVPHGDAVEVRCQ